MLDLRTLFSSSFERYDSTPIGTNLLDAGSLFTECFDRLEALADVAVPFSAELPRLFGTECGAELVCDLLSGEMELAPALFVPVAFVACAGG